MKQSLTSAIGRLNKSWSQWFGALPLGALPLGLRGENAVAIYLRRRGYSIVGRSKKDFLGEIDLIAIDKRVVVFVEVKTRSSQLKGAPELAIDREKQWRLTRLALSYLKRHDLLQEKARFDTVSVIWPKQKRRPEKIDHVINAFVPTGHASLFS